MEIGALVTKEISLGHVIYKEVRVVFSGMDLLVHPNYGWYLFSNLYEQIFGIEIEFPFVVISHLNMCEFLCVGRDFIHDLDY